MSWTPNDAVALRQYGGSSPAFLAELKARIPHCTGATLEERAVTGSEAEGARKIIEYIEIVMMADKSPDRDKMGFIIS